MALIEETMSNYLRYFFIMPTLARFELEMHERAEKGEPINAQYMIDLTAKLFKEGYGEEVEFDKDRIGITWAQFGHMYANFYVYQYATGISGANALVNRVLSEGDEAANDYLEFLKAGNSMYSLDALEKAGVDTFAGHSENKNGMQGVSKEMFIMPLINAVQELTKQNADLLARIEQLENK